MLGTDAETSPRRLVQNPAALLSKKKKKDRKKENNNAAMMNTHLCRGRFVSGEFNLWAVVVLLGCKLGKKERKKEKDQKKKDSRG